MEKLKQRWGISSNFDILMILVVFAVTGTTSVKIARPILEFLGFTRSLFGEEWYFSVLYWTIRILVIFPIYQCLLIVFGWLFGQFKFFWGFEKKMLSRMGLGFLFNKS